MSSNNGNAKTYYLHPIGTVRTSDEVQSYLLQIEEPYRAGLKQLDQFSHVMIFWWADKMDTEQYRQIRTTQLPYAPGVEAGVFVCRSEYRPNPIAVTTMMILHVDVEAGVVVVFWIDAFDGTPVLDLKPSSPFRTASAISRLLSGWPIGLSGWKMPMRTSLTTRSISGSDFTIPVTVEHLSLS